MITTTTTSQQHLNDTSDQMKNKNKISLSEKFKNQIKFAERGKIVTTNIQIHDSSLFWFDTGTSIKSVWIKLVLCAQTSLLGEVMSPSLSPW
jgi:hypothetical protein